MLTTLVAPGAAGLDELRLTTGSLVPEVKLYLAQDPIVLWARLEARAGHVLPPPFWASAWGGGQALARYVVDHPEQVVGRRVLDVASGSGLVAIAAAIAGAAAVTANDIDPYALDAITLNAGYNGVAVTPQDGDLLDGDGGDADLVLAGDVFYSQAMAVRVSGFLQRVSARGARVLVGDPGRAFLPEGSLEVVATYRVPAADAVEDAELTHAYVLRPWGAAERSSRPGGVG